MRMRTKLFTSQLDAAVAILEKDPRYSELAQGLRGSAELYKNATVRKRKWSRAWYEASPEKAKAYRQAGKKRRGPELSTAEQLDAMVAMLRQPLNAKANSGT